MYLLGVFWIPFRRIHTFNLFEYARRKKCFIVFSNGESPTFEIYLFQWTFKYHYVEHHTYCVIKIIISSMPSVFFLIVDFAQLRSANLVSTLRSAFCTSQGYTHIIFITYFIQYIFKSLLIYYFYDQLSEFKKKLPSNVDTIHNKPGFTKNRFWSAVIYYCFQIQKDTSQYHEQEGCIAETRRSLHLVCAFIIVV